MSASVLFGAVGSGVDDGGGVVSVPPGLSELEFVLWMLRTGQYTPQYPQPKHPSGYIAPAPIFIDVPNEALGIGPAGGTQQVKSVETILQGAVQALAGRIATQNWTDTKVRADLLQESINAAKWLAGHDPASKDIPSLVEKYVQIYRTAVTPT